ncbi:MAG: alpha/beta hydrolase [Caldilineaceae bacterium]|nr:alpha/beta hydrolase [Caldilineaceae bacterium]
MKHERSTQGKSPEPPSPDAYRPIEQLIPDHWRQEIVVANGIRQQIHRTGGDKPPMVLLHGFMESGLTWLRMAKTLEADYDVILVDARAHGRSDRPETPLTPELLAEDAAALIETLTLQQPILFGRSNGAVTAVLVALAQPTLARALILEEPPLGGMPRPNVQPDGAQGGGNWFEAWLSWLRGLRQQPHLERIASSAARWPHGIPVLPDEPVWPEEEFVPWVEALAQFDTTVFRRKISFWSLLPYVGQLAQIPAPILLMGGNPEYGSLVPEGAEEAAEWRGRTVVRFARAGHLVSRGRSFGGCLAAVQRFLREQTPPQ